MAKVNWGVGINWAGRMVFRLTVLGLLGYISYFQFIETQNSTLEHIVLDQHGRTDHNAIYGECKKPIL